MATANEQIKQILKKQPDDSTYDEFLRGLTLKRMVDRGLKDVQEGNVLTNEEMERRIKSWQK